MNKVVAIGRTNGIVNVQRGRSGGRADRGAAYVKILVLNLGSTSSKFGVFNDLDCVFSHTLRHPKEALQALQGQEAHLQYRRQAVQEALEQAGHPIPQFDVLALRGGLIRPVPGGIFVVDQQVAEDARSERYGSHPSNLGLQMGWAWSQQYGIPAIFVDAPVTDELSDVARISGFAGTSRRSVFHALNAKRIIRLHAQQHNQPLADSRYIVAHMGGGITVGAFAGLRAIDVNNGVDGEGPFSPERTGYLSSRILLDLVDKHGGDTQAVYTMLYKRGGLQSYFGTNDVQLLCQRAQHEPEVRLVLDGMIYQVAKQIGAMAVALEGRVQGILITGGLAYAKDVTDALTQLVKWIAPCSIYPGEDELAALAEGAFRYYNKQEEAHHLGD